MNNTSIVNYTANTTPVIPEPEENTSDLGQSAIFAISISACAFVLFVLFFFACISREKVQAKVDDDEKIVPLDDVS